MARRTTITDVAREARVSVATVDRVLNGRAKVREDTARRVYDAAKRIGYHAASLIGQRMAADLPEISFGFVFLKPRHAFWQSAGVAAEDAVRTAPQVRGRSETVYADTQTPAEFAALIEDLASRNDAVAACAVAHPAVTEAVKSVQAAGTPCFAIMNDFAQGERHSYSGLNNLKVGRIAGHMVATAAKSPGKLAVFVGGHRWHGHELRETGFRAYMREWAPDFRILDTIVNLETRQLTYEAALTLLERQPDIKGIYCAGGGMEGAIAALRETRKPGDVALVVSELAPDSRMALADRYASLVISTPIDRLFRETVDLMTRAVLNKSESVAAQYFLDPLLWLPESV